MTDFGSGPSQFLTNQAGSEPDFNGILAAFLWVPSRRPCPGRTYGQIEISMKKQLLASLLSLPFFTLPLSQASAEVLDLVCFETNLGEFCLHLFPEDAPQTVANFLKYVEDGDFDDTIVHRSVPGFVVQAGG